MKFAGNALLVAAGVALIWVVTKGKTQNLPAAWNALLAGPSAAHSGGGLGGGLSLPWMNRAGALSGAPAGPLVPPLSGMPAPGGVA